MEADRMDSWRIATSKRPETPRSFAEDSVESWKPAGAPSPEADTEAGEPSQSQEQQAAP